MISVTSYSITCYLTHEKSLNLLASRMVSMGLCVRSRCFFRSTSSFSIWKRRLFGPQAVGHDFPPRRAERTVWRSTSLCGRKST